jgi:hypothetical protein
MTAFRLAFAAIAITVVAAIAGSAAFSQMMHGHGAGGGGGMGMMHDMTGMPGLRGTDATEEESDELAIMFNGFQTFEREVTLLDDGIRTVTRSSDPQVMEALVSHVSGMIGRVEDGRDPGVFIQSPTLDIFFARGDAIESDIEVTDAGIVVTQTSTDPEVVAALQTHAGEVSDMAERGMHAVHERMMRGASN